MTAAFDAAFATVIGNEGGFTKNPTDKGNWTGGAVGVGELRGTKYGISAASYPTLDIENLTLDAAKAIYQRDFWAQIRGDDMPAPLDTIMFDGAVNSGARMACQWLQDAVGTYVDGKIGPVTMAALASRIAVQPRGVLWVCAEFQARRCMFDASLGTWKAFGLGWSRRLFHTVVEVSAGQAPIAEPASAA